VKAVAVADGRLVVARQDGAHAVAVHHQQHVVGFEPEALLPSPRGGGAGGEGQRPLYQLPYVLAGVVVVGITRRFQQTRNAPGIGERRVARMTQHQRAGQCDRLGLAGSLGKARRRVAAFFQPAVELARQRHGVRGHHEAIDLLCRAVIARVERLAHLLGKDRRP